MSIRAVTDLATERDRLPPTATTAQYADILTKTVPTESLAAYTAFIALVETQSGLEDTLIMWRWGAFVGFLALTLISALTLYYAKSRAAGPSTAAVPQRWAPFELVPTMISAAAWGLAMPGGPLTTELTGSSGVLAVAAVIIGGGALVTTTGIPLKSGTPTAPTDDRSTDPEELSRAEDSRAGAQPQASRPPQAQQVPEPRSASPRSAQSSDPSPTAQRPNVDQRFTSAGPPASPGDSPTEPWGPAPTTRIHRPGPS